MTLYSKLLPPDPGKKNPYAEVHTFCDVCGRTWEGPAAVIHNLHLCDELSFWVAAPPPPVPGEFE